MITYDHRGVGGSDKPSVPYTTRMFADDAAGLLSALGIGSAHVLGHSMGGRVAQWMALDRPEMVRSLVLVASGAGQSDPNYTMVKGIPLKTTVELVEKGYEGYMREHFASPFYYTPEYVRDHPDEAAATFRAYWAGHPPLEFYLRHIIARQQHQTAELVDKIKVPTLVIVADRDTEVGSTGSHFTQSEFLAQRIPGADFVVFPGAAHMFLWERTEEAGAMIAEWMRKH